MKRIALASLALMALVGCGLSQPAVGASDAAARLKALSITDIQPVKPEEVDAGQPYNVANVPVTKNISAADVNDYQAVLVPGGAWNPVIMRTDGSILNFVRAAFGKGLLIASLCHGPQVLISAGIVKGLDITGVGDIRIDLANAGATVHDDRSVVLSKNLLTSRDPNDLADFSQAIEGYLTAAKSR